MFKDQGIILIFFAVFIHPSWPANCCRKPAEGAPTIVFYIRALKTKETVFSLWIFKHYQDRQNPCKIQILSVIAKSSV